MVAVDTPLSLAGDVLTYPLARGRSNGESWATWWGDQGGARPTVEPAPEAAAPEIPAAPTPDLPAPPPVASSLPVKR
jgi:hypothetical protein